MHLTLLYLILEWIYQLLNLEVNILSSKSHKFFVAFLFLNELWSIIEILLLLNKYEDLDKKNIIFD